ncbi:LOW QUALITY PROTEIN: hypothetical protein HID58_077606 [Brassica napus]|uniref:Protein kinase domain-containing protein n=1 Tax=Brassica napus TaxID=3708 RepID=A0ABQ7YRY3_BRANA|nr:LOW QUALITY PROTEIN: hypothetical protein HID58_077606 [Brassica napus]
MTARIFRSPFTYSFPVASGRKFVRLYFHPNSYDASTPRTPSSLSVTLGSSSYTLLKTSSRCSNSSGLVLLFHPTPDGTLSIVDLLLLSISITAPLLRMFTGLTWEGMISLLLKIQVFTGHGTTTRLTFRCGIGVVDTADPNMTIKYPADTPTYIAPVDVYSTARSMTPTAQSTSLQPDLALTLASLILLHFCEVLPNITKINQRWFTIYLNNQTAESEADVAGWTRGNGIPIHKDYVVNPPDVEIFKMNGSDGNLAGPNPVPGPQVTADPSKVLRPRTSQSKSRTAIVAGVGGFHFLLWKLAFRWLGEDKHYRKLRLVPSFKPVSSLLFAEIKAATKNFDESRVLGVGVFGKVYRGEIDGGTTKVAIKRGNPMSEQGVHEFQTEIEMLSKLRHRHLVSLIGYCEENCEMILVYDYMAHGTMREHLYKTQNSPLPSLEATTRVALSAHRCEHTIIHRDVKTTNILLDEKWVAKVSDFGLLVLHLTTPRKHRRERKLRLSRPRVLQTSTLTDNHLYTPLVSFSLKPYVHGLP